MQEELGNCRLDDLPMDDGGFSRQDDVPLSLSLPQGNPTNNKWKMAIANGAFDDDDAIQVAGMDNIADGQLARIHRASRFASKAVTAGYDDQRLRRGQSGQIDPRAQFPRSQKGPSIAGQAHRGDGPVQVPNKLSYNHRAPAAPGMNGRPSNTSVTSGTRAARRGPAPPGFGKQPGNASVSSNIHGNHPLQPSGSEPSPVRVQNSSPQVQQQPEATRLVLPDGASIVFQVRAEIASPAFLNKNAKFPGIVYLIAGRNQSDDQIMLRIENEGIEDVKHSPGEYGNLMMQSQEVILQFRTATGSKAWYIVKFRQRDDMVVFVNALRNFVDHPNADGTLRATSTAAVVDQDRIGAGQSAMMNAPSQATMPDTMVVSSSAANESGLDEPSSAASHPSPLATHAPQSSPSIDPFTSVQPRAGQAAIASSQQQDAATTVPANLVEDIVTWAISIVTALRESGPAELARFDALPGVIRGTASAVLLCRHPGFGRLAHEQRTAYIDEHCIPRVFELFKRRFLGHAAQDQSTRAVQTTQSQDQTSQEARASTLSKPPRIVYTTEHLMRLRSAAKSPPHWLPELGFLKEAARSFNQQARTSGLQWDETCDAPVLEYKNQPQQVASENAEWQHNGRAPASSSPSMSKTSKPFVEAFQTRERRDTGSTIQSAPDTGRSRSPDRNPSPMRSLSTQTSQDDVSVVATPASAANAVNDMAVGGFEGRNEEGTNGLDEDYTPASVSMSPGNDAGTTWDQLTSSETPQAPAITVTAPDEQGNADGISSAHENSMQWDTEPQETPDAMEVETEEPPPTILDDHSGLNASMFNPGRVDLLGEASGSWTGVLAQNKSYMEDLMSID